MSSLHLILRPSTKSGHHPGSLYLRVIHERKAKTFAIGCHLYSDEWDADNQSILYPEDSQRIRVLEEAEDKIASCISILEHLIDLLEKQGHYTVDDLMSRYHSSKDNGKLLGWVESLCRDLRRDGQHRLARAYHTVALGLVRYNKGQDILLTQINAALIKGFEKHLMNKGRMPNTISYYMRNLRSIYNKAMAAKRIPSRQGNPFAGVYTKVKTTAKRALTIEEITRLYEIDFKAMKSRYATDSSQKLHVERLQHSWRLFMFCFVAQGMCFIDLAHLKKENIRDGVCTYYRKKTSQQVEVTVNDAMQRIIDSFSEDVAGCPYLFPVLREAHSGKQTRYDTALRTQNRRLKVLAKLAGIDKRVTTHVSRHSFATIVRGGGIPTGVISQMLGHTTEKMTHNYLASFDRSYFDQAYSIILAALSGNKASINI